MNAIRKLFFGFILGRIFGDVEKGKFGTHAQDAYLWTQGHKTTIAFLFTCLSGAIVTQYPSAAAPLGVVSTVLWHAGLVDKGRRATPPAWFKDAYLYLATAGASGAYLLSGLATYLGQIPGCPACSEWSGYIELGLAAVGVACSWIAGLLDGGQEAPKA